MYVALKWDVSGPDAAAILAEAHLSLGSRKFCAIDSTLRLVKVEGNVDYLTLVRDLGRVAADHPNDFLFSALQLQKNAPFRTNVPHDEECVSDVVTT